MKELIRDQNPGICGRINCLWLPEVHLIRFLTAQQGYELVNGVG